MLRRLVRRRLLRRLLDVSTTSVIFFCATMLKRVAEKGRQRRCAGINLLTKLYLKEKELEGWPSIDSLLPLRSIKSSNYRKRLVAECSCVSSSFPTQIFPRLPDFRYEALPSCFSRVSRVRNTLSGLASVHDRPQGRDKRIHTPSCLLLPLLLMTLSFVNNSWLFQAI
jgi:hypothetical protein